MDRHDNKFRKTVFRMRQLPYSFGTLDSVARLVSTSLGDIAAGDVCVFSLATSLGFANSSQSKVATIMFATIPSLVRDNPDANQWEIAIRDPILGHHLLLDTHFEGMTVMNEVDYPSHKFDCIAISGLGSHPFGSWQPKKGDKTFMWIRDALPKHVHGTRTVVYGYETGLAESQSIERIKDLASRLITLLTTYGWGTRSSKPIIFLAHSLGGLLIRDALRQLTDSSTEECRRLLSNIHGALYFGVPNLGIEHGSLWDIAQGNPNETLIEDIGRGSNYLRRLNESSTHKSVNHLKQFWAYETLESPTVVRTSDGHINRNGPRAILVSRESATLRLVDNNSSVTFPIRATHSEMVKFTRGSSDCHIVVSKISSIVNAELDHHLLQNSGQDLVNHQATGSEAYRTAPSGVIEGNNTAQLDDFRRVSGVTPTEESKFSHVTYDTIKDTAHEIQRLQEERGDLMDMQRLAPILTSMKQFAEVSEAIVVTFGVSNPMSYVWGPMEYILRASYLCSDEFNCILDAYQEIGEQVPKLSVYKGRLAMNRHLKHVLAMIYSDILWFHGEILRRLKQRERKTLFKSMWGDLATCLDHIKDNIARSHRLIENNASLREVEEVQNLRSSSISTFKTNKVAEDISHRSTILQWLSPYDYELDHARHCKTRSVCKSPGQWLLMHRQFQEWTALDLRSGPFLWLNGIPGAGKTVLASIIIDHLRLIPDAAVAYFYCKHGDETRASFIAVARAILAQLLLQRPHLTPYFFEKASTNGHALLNSTVTAREMIETSIKSCDKLYIIIDGVDECGHIHRDETIDVFHTSIENLPAEAFGSVRCLFVSQDDGTARRRFRNFPTIKICDQSEGDIKDFAENRHLALEAKFGPLRSKDCHISRILVARARGMFIFANLFSTYLENRDTKADLLAELDPSKLPVTLDHVYNRILERIFETRDDTNRASVQKILGWITCALRPFKWSEIQGAVCVDWDNQVVDNNRKFSDSPKGLFASLIEIREDGTVELVHETAREYLCKHVIVPREVNYSLAMASIGYLTLPQLDMNRPNEDVLSDLVNGTYSFYDYASACWAMHLQRGMSELKAGSDLSLLLEALETFIELHWSPTHKPLQDLKSVRSALDSAKISTCFDQIVFAVGWAKRQSSKYGQGPTPDEALDLWQITDKIRSVLEDAQRSEPSEHEETLQRFYGRHWFKCPRVNCLRYYQGFSTFEQRQHHLNKHDRPFLCYVSGCYMEVFGYATNSELKKHLLKYHGIDSFDDTSEDEFPAPSKRKTTVAPRSDASYTCRVCDKKFTRNHNLQNHLRSHQGLKPYECHVCGDKFTRKSDCDRHERGHGEKKFICTGSLKNGETWGCNKAFGRLDKLVDHFRSTAGSRCIRPQLEEKMRENPGDTGEKDIELFDNQTGENADALRAAGKSLPPFQEFLQLCGLSLDVTEGGVEATGSGE
ncbi:hypothetical protein F5Y01DRAFT_239570 [Xylaria sp. FL0043]|nr:hypothetical protein F5Y01DRAFT_239570 [Xylaria sp. FL0043]